MPTRYVYIDSTKIGLNDSDHLGTGGEASVYAKDNTAIKLYADPRRVISAHLDKKVDLIKNINHPSIIVPKGMVTNESGIPIGYYMKKVTGKALVSMYPNGWWKRTSFTYDLAASIVDQTRDTVIEAHKNSVVLVDANEKNWLVNQTSWTPYLVDFDSCKVGRWDATYIMPSIRDFQSDTFNELTDWFSWGVVTFQLWTGIHPYRGSVDGYDSTELLRRMTDKISVFNSKVRLNAGVRDFNKIPGALLQWYHDTFESDFRSCPPTTSTKKAVGAFVKHVYQSQGVSNLKLTLLCELPESISRYFYCGVVLTSKNKLFDIKSGKYLPIDLNSYNSSNIEVISFNGRHIVAMIDIKKVVKLYLIDNNRFELVYEEQSLAHEILSYRNRLLLTTVNGLVELVVFSMSNGKVIVSTGAAWGSLLKSTTWFSNIGIQDSIGAKWIIVIHGDDSCSHIRIKQLDGKRVVNAVSDNRYAATISIDKSGSLIMDEFYIGQDYQSYKLINTKSVTSTELNIIPLKKGVVASINTDYELSLFVPSTGKYKIINDKNISTSMILIDVDQKAGLIVDNKIFSISTT